MSDVIGAQYSIFRVLWSSGWFLRNFLFQDDTETEKEKLRLTHALKLMLMMVFFYCGCSFHHKVVRINNLICLIYPFRSHFNTYSCARTYARKQKCRPVQPASLSKRALIWNFVTFGIRNKLRIYCFGAGLFILFALSSTRHGRRINFWFCVCVCRNKRHMQANDWDAHATVAMDDGERKYAIINKWMNK